MNDDNLAKAALGFGGGIARSQSECGALAGGVMAIGLQLGAKLTIDQTPESEAARQRIREESTGLLAAFKKNFGQTHCRKLTGYNFNLPGVYQIYRADGRARGRCFDYVAFVVKKLAELG